MTGVDYPYTQVNEPGSILVPGASFSPFLLYDCGCETPPIQPQSLALTNVIEPPAVSTIVAPAAPAESGIDWVVVLIVAGILLIAIGGNQ